MVVLVCAVAAVWPEVRVVACDGGGWAVVPESYSLGHTVAEPHTTVAVGTHVSRPPDAVGTHADAVERLVHDGAWLLVTGIGAYAHPAAIAAVGCRGARAVCHADAEPMDACQVVPVVIHREVDGIIDAVVDCLVTAVVVPMAYGTLGDCGELDDIAITHGIVFGDGVCAHIVHCSWLEVAQPVDLSSLVDVFSGAVVGYLRVWILAPAEALLYDIASLNGAAAEGPSASLDEAWVGGDGRWSSRSVGDLELESGFRQGLDGGLCLNVGLGGVIGVLSGIDGALVGGFLRG